MFTYSIKAQRLSFFLFFIVTIQFISCTNQQVVQQSSIFTAIKDLFNKSLDIQQEEEVVVDTKKKLTLQIEQPSHDKMCYLVMDQLCKLAEQPFVKSSSLDKTFLKKMELYVGEEQPKNSLLNKVNETETVFGYVMLARQLGQPTYDAALLRNRQQIIQYLLKNEQVLTAIQEQLAVIKAAEPYFISYFQKENVVNEELFKKVYWGERLNFLNNSPLALEIVTRLDNLGTFFSLSMLPSLAFASRTLTKTGEVMMKKGHQDLPSVKQLLKEGAVEAIKTLPDEFDPRLDAYKGLDAEMFTDWSDKVGVDKNGFDIFAQKSFKDLSLEQRQGKLQFKPPHTLGDRIYWLKNVTPVVRNIGIAFNWVIPGLLTAWYGYSAYKAVQDAQLKQAIINHLQTRMIAVASYINALKTLTAIINTDPVLSELIDVSALNNLFTEQSSLSADAKKLLEILDHNTFTGDASVFSLSGRVLAAHRLMQKVNEELVPACAAAGQLDAYLSTAKLYSKHQNTPAQFCMPEFIDKSLDASLTAEEFWNLFIDAYTVVVNSILIGEKNPNNIILTGPNTGGKSTVIKGLLINILLAQTLGIAPAKSLIFTLFANLNCYLNITDDLTAGTSLFKAEVLRAKALINSVRALTEGEFSFTIIDEVFSGTSPKEGEEAALLFAQELGAMNNSLCTIATHFPRLTDELSDEHYKNYKVTVYKDAEGKWVRPYKLEEGKSLLNIAMDLLREEGIFN